MLEHLGMAVTTDELATLMAEADPDGQCSYTHQPAPATSYHPPPTPVTGQHMQPSASH